MQVELPPVIEFEKLNEYLQEANSRGSGIMSIPVRIIAPIEKILDGHVVLSDPKGKSKLPIYVQVPPQLSSILKMMEAKQLYVSGNLCVDCYGFISLTLDTDKKGKPLVEISKFPSYDLSPNEAPEPIL
jgi:hypothetical protein